ncbi:peptide-methionine (S)-S-oxide reductase MsrA [Rhodobacteraceae bacterium]|nr:peptide-methionine (S)-S-oxide reductase MsrA [Paracoccaceae bacterium]
MFQLFRKNVDMVSADEALAGRDAPIQITEPHFVFDRPLSADVPDGFEVAIFGMGCFWGVERMFWKLDGVWLTMVGYGAGHTENATYEEVCSGKTGHNEIVRVVYDPSVIGYDELLRVFWEGHNPTQGMRQGNDVGTQYRSGIYWTNEAQRRAAEASKAMFGPRLSDAGHGAITTEIIEAGAFYFAETYHQQYLAKNPSGYCGIGGTGVTCPIGMGVRV